LRASASSSIQPSARPASVGAKASSSAQRAPASSRTGPGAAALVAQAPASVKRAASGPVTRSRVRVTARGPGLTSVRLRVARAPVATRPKSISSLAAASPSQASAGAGVVPPWPRRVPPRSGRPPVSSTSQRAAAAPSACGRKAVRTRHWPSGGRASGQSCCSGKASASLETTAPIAISPRGCRLRTSTLRSGACVPTSCRPKSWLVGHGAGSTSSAPAGTTVAR